MAIAIIPRLEEAAPLLPGAREDNRSPFMGKISLIASAIFKTLGSTFTEAICLNIAAKNGLNDQVVEKLNRSTEKKAIMKAFAKVYKLMALDNLISPDALDANINPQNQSTLMKYVGNGQLRLHFEVIKTLTYAGANLDKQDINGNTALHYICSDRSHYRTNKKIIKHLVSNGANCEIRNQTGKTAPEIIFDSYIRQVNFLKQFTLLKTILLFLCLLIPVVQLLAATCIAHYFQEKVENKHTTEILDILLTKGASLYQDKKPSQTDLMVAIEKDHTELAELLIKLGHNLDAQDETGITALIYAAANDNIKLTKLLIQKGANINITDIYGISALHGAIICDNTKIAKLLINSGANREVNIDWAKKMRYEIGRFIRAKNRHPNRDEFNQIRQMIQNFKDRLRLSPLLEQARVKVKAKMHQLDGALEHQLPSDVLGIMSQIITPDL